MNPITKNFLYLSDADLNKIPGIRSGELSSKLCCCHEQMVFGGVVLTPSRKCSWCRVAEHFGIKFPKSIKFLNEENIWEIEYLI